MAGRTASSAITRYPGIQVQTSSLGVNIPVGWGTFRCKCNLVDYLDFKSTAQHAGAGKGGAPTGYNYAATVILAVCEGPIDAITQVWVNGKQFAHGSVGSSVANTGSTIATTQAGLSMSLGTIGQAPWSYLVSKHPDHAIGYSGLVLAFAENYPLGASAATPNHSFEVVRTTGFAVGGGYAGPDADPSLVITDFFQNTRTGVPGWNPGLLGDLSQYQDYCLAAGLLVSPVIDQQRSGADFIKELLLATNSTCVWSEGVLKFIPYGDTALSGAGKTYTPDNSPVYSLTDDDYVVAGHGAEPPLQADIQDQSDAFNVVQLEYLDRVNQYNMAIALASDAANVAQYGQRRKDPTTVHCICTPAVAAVAAQLHLQRTLYIRANYRLSLGWQFALLEPGDLLELTDSGLGLAAYPVRITQIDEDQDGVLALTCEDYPVGVHNTPLFAMQTGVGTQLNQNVDPGGVEANLLLWSQDFTNAVWISGALTIAAAAAANPITGAVDAQKATPSTAAANHRLRQQLTLSAGANYTLSGYFQAAGYRYLRFSLVDSVSLDEIYLDVDLTTGAIVTPAAGVLNGVLVGASVTDAGGGWQRIALTGQLPAVTTALARLFVLNAPFAGPSTGLPTWTGDGTDGVLLWGLALTQGVDIRPYAKTTTAIAGPLIFNPPTALTPAGVAMWAAVAGGSNWGGASVWVSFDGTSYEQVGQINGPARFGITTASLAAGSDPDVAHTLSVDLSPSGGVLTGAAQAVADASGTLCLVESELVAFTTATPTAGIDRYDLTTYLRRGVLGTAIAAHGVGAPFIRLDSGVFDFPYLATQAGQAVSVKFQSFNLWGNAATPLSQCLAYGAVPIPVGARPPASGAWTAAGTVLSNGGQSTPAIVISGHSDNPAATGIEFFYRQSGTSAWISAGVGSNATTQKIITSIAPNQTYDVAVAYIVGGVLGQLQVITVGGATSGGGGSGGAPGTTLLSDSVAGAGKTFTCPAGSYGHVDIVLTGFPGAGSGSGSKSGFTDTGGGGAGVVVVKGFPVTPGTTVFTYTLPAAVGSDASCTATGLALTAHPGANASAGASGAGGAASSGNTATGATSLTAYGGHGGGLTDTWDGGGAADLNGTYVDNTSDNSAARLVGQGGAGSWLGAQPGGGCNLLILART